MSYSSKKKKKKKKRQENTYPDHFKTSPSFSFCPSILHTQVQLFPPPPLHGKKSDAKWAHMIVAVTQSL